MKSLLVITMTILLYSCTGETTPAETTTDTTVAEMTSSGVPVPAPVSSAFHSSYADVTTARWEVKDSMFSALFNNNGLDMSVVYYPDGQRHAVIAAIALEYLPEPVSKSAGTLGTITAANKITMDNTSTRYEILIDGKNYIYDENGAMIQEEADTK